MHSPRMLMGEILIAYSKNVKGTLCMLLGRDRTKYSLHVAMAVKDKCFLHVARTLKDEVLCTHC